MLQSSSSTLSLQALEAKLKAQLKLKNPDESVVKPIRRQLLEQYVRLIVRDCELAVRLGVEANLWKLCHYKKMDEYRRAQARSQEQLQDPAKSAAAEQVLTAATQQFGRFLDKSTSLYLALLQKAALACALVLPGYGRAASAAWPDGLEVEVDTGKLSPRQREAIVGRATENEEEFRMISFLLKTDFKDGRMAHDN